MELDIDVIRDLVRARVNMSFIIDYKELVFEKKIGEGGTVYLVKYLVKIKDMVKSI